MESGGGPSVGAPTIYDFKWRKKMVTGFSWENSGPNKQALAAFAKVTDERREFPHTYSGQAWRAAYRLWLAIKDKPIDVQKSETADGFAYDPAWNWGGERGGDDLGLSGFMAGWAINAVRQMLDLKAIPNPAVINMDGPQEPLPDTGPAEGMMKTAIGESGERVQ
jgi:hypothetical protein